MVFDGAAWAPGSPAEALEKGIAMVHQHFSLVPRMTVVENLMLGQVRGVLKRHEFGARIRDIAESFGFTLDPEAVVGELSVGERQRAEIVKCLMRDPKLLVLDEPTAVLPPGEIGALARHLPPRRRFRPRRHPGDAQARRDRQGRRSRGRAAHRPAGRRREHEGRRHGRAGPCHGRPRVAPTRRGARRGRRGASRRGVRWAEGLRPGLRRPHGARPPRRRAARQLHPGNPSRRDRRAGGRRGQRPERARHGLGRPAAADRGPLLYRRHRSHPCRRRGRDGGGRRHRAGGPPCRGLRHRHVGRREHVLEQARPLHALWPAAARRAERGGAEADARVRRARRRPRGRLLGPVQAAISRRRCWRAS